MNQQQLLDAINELAKDPTGPVTVEIEGEVNQPYHVVTVEFTERGLIITIKHVGA